jgi:hypothetical protein
LKIIFSNTQTSKNVWTISQTTVSKFTGKSFQVWSKGQRIEMYKGEPEKNSSYFYLLVFLLYENNLYISQILEHSFTFVNLQTTPFKRQQQHGSL